MTHPHVFHWAQTALLSEDLLPRFESGYRAASVDRDFHKTAMDFLEPAGFLLLAGVEASTVGFEETILSSWPAISIYDAALFD